MEPALKQRLVGAAVLVALAVIFLPMLIKGPAPESGVGDIPLDVPPEPAGEFETRELPLLPPRTPAPAQGGEDEEGLVAGGGLPTVDTAGERAQAASAEQAEAESEMMPPATAGGGFAVSFGSYANPADAQRVVAALLASQLAGYQEPEQRDGRTLHRVRIGPFDSRATAEVARLRAAHVRDDVGSQVVVLDAARHPDAAELADAPQERPVRKPDPQPARQTGSGSERQPAVARQPEPDAPAAPAAPKPTAATPPATTPPAAAVGTGFAVQLGSFSSEASANALRDRARSQGLSAFVEAVQTDKGRVHRVQVGPVADRAAAEQLRVQAKARLQIDGLVHSHP
ncbi:SPOR domain-containing protein [Lysobacter sp. GX 14042]|uniref:SPOR domain-containing protein n=1 Tax=Lysobacter sp. GX 14042 TaxID=2907155 RepID=UPI001F43B6FB|nr:SPOR domain-containing protein [Lysobacter sp. GX 14042]MCE7033263.1 SPOR domain-containing protein [Lysobacter sp. GX 14042]